MNASATGTRLLDNLVACEAIAPIQNKGGEFLVNPILRRTAGHGPGKKEERYCTLGNKSAYPRGFCLTRPRLLP
jgi:hypothetical protein